MANMSYCRFRNTLADFRDCLDSIHDVDEDNDDEIRARARLAELAREYIDEFDNNYAEA